MDEFVTENKRFIANAPDFCAFARLVKNPSKEWVTPVWYLNEERHARQSNGRFFVSLALPRNLVNFIEKAPNGTFPCLVSYLEILYVIVHTSVNPYEYSLTNRYAGCPCRVRFNLNPRLAV